MILETFYVLAEIRYRFWIRIRFCPFLPDPDLAKKDADPLHGVLLMPPGPVLFKMFVADQKAALLQSGRQTDSKSCVI